VPSILGVMLGARVGVVLLRRIGEESARRLTIGLLVLAGARALMLGLAS
jgi:uncharacterized membrane protein YfcA